MTYDWMALAPFNHQDVCFELSKDRRHFAYLMEQGTGKTKVVCDKTIHLFLADKIDALVVVAPNGVHRNWIEREVPVHFAKVPHCTLLWQPNQTKTFQAECKKMLEPDAPGKRVLRIIAINVEAFSRKDSPAEKFLRKFLAKWRTHMAVDESSKIKTWSAKRTKRVITVGRLADCRAIMTGTPVTQGPFDFFPQFQFLKNGALGYDTLTPFKAYYAEWKDTKIPGALPDPRTGLVPTYKDLVGYKNLPELKRLVSAMSYTITKAECLDLPPKVYEPPRFCEATPEMRQLYTRALKDIMVWIDENQTLTIRSILTRMLRLGQITGGFVTPDDTGDPQPIEGGNPKIDGLFTILDELRDDDKVIIWARFVPELRLITQELRALHGKNSVARWWGEVPEETRSCELDSFMRDTDRKWFVGQQHSGGYGLTATAANHVIYYSNDFSYEARSQSEDRAHRIGQKRSVTYWDLVVPRTVDEKVLAVLCDKREMADYFKTPAEVKQWLA